MPNQTIYLYRNGDLSDNGFPLSFTHRKFKSVRKFVQYINDELEIAKKPHGYKYLFTTEGEEVDTMHDVEYGKTYVLSMNRRFVDGNYGQVDEEEESDDRGSKNRSRNDRGSKNRSRNRSGGSRGSRSRKSTEKSNVQEDELAIAKSYNFRREKTRKRNLDRYPTKEDTKDMYSDYDEYSDDDKDEIEVTIFRNGNYSDPGSYVEIDKNQFRSSRFSQFMTYVNEQLHLLGLSSGIRHIYATDGVEIRKVDDLQHKGKYVVAAGRFTKLNYGENALYLKGKRRKVKPKGGSRSSGRRGRGGRDRDRDDDDDDNPHNKDITVTVFENGNNTDPGEKVEVPRENLRNFDDLLEYLKKNLHADGRRGYRNLYTESGKPIRATRQIQDGDQLVIATGRFINLRYGEHYQKMREIREKVNRQRQENKENKDKRRTHSDSELGRRRTQSRGGAGGGRRRRDESTATESSTDPYSDYDTVDTGSDDRSKSRGRDSSRGRSESRGRSPTRDDSDMNRSPTRDDSDLKRSPTRDDSDLKRSPTRDETKRSLSRDRTDDRKKSKGRRRKGGNRKSREDTEAGDRRVTYARQNSRENSSLERKKRHRQRRYSA